MISRATITIAPISTAMPTLPIVGITGGICMRNLASSVFRLARQEYRSRGSEKSTPRRKDVEVAKVTQREPVNPFLGISFFVPFPASLWLFPFFVALRSTAPTGLSLQLPQGFDQALAGRLGVRRLLGIREPHPPGPEFRKIHPRNDGQTEILGQPGAQLATVGQTCPVN